LPDDLVSSDEDAPNGLKNMGRYAAGETPVGEVLKTGLLSDSSSENDEGLDHSNMLGMITSSSQALPDRIVNTVGCSVEEGVYGSSWIVDKNASRISFFDVCSSGELENRSVSVGVHAVEGSNDDATDSVILAVDIRPARIKSKLKEFALTCVEILGAQFVEGHDVGGETLDCENIPLVSIWGTECGLRVGIVLRLCSSTRIRFSWSLWLKPICGWARRIDRAVSTVFAADSSS
jgi:hypothetical protein